jgi:two-component system, chemotaxis family, sensor kinase CheA
MDDRFDTAALLAEFREEARQQLDLLDRALLAAEGGEPFSESDRVELLRVLHTLKGNSAMIGLKAIAEQVHALENVFKSNPPQEGPQLDALFELSATLRSALDRLGGPEQDAALARVSAIDLTERFAIAGPSEPSGPPDAVTPSADRLPGAPAASPSGPASAESQRSGDVADARSPPSHPAAAADAAVAPAPSPTATGDILRVPFQKLDLLLSQVGELVGVHDALEEFLDRHRIDLANADLFRELRERVEDLAGLGDALRDTTMGLRLVPVRAVFGRFPGLVRELAREEGKQARVTLEGEDIELDKSAVDALAEPLLHLVRNAVDHGIEPPEVREAAGKPATGAILLRASRHGDRVRIEVSDDGSGLDRAAILRRAHRQGLLAEGHEPGGEEIFDLIFAPGFSTRSEATTISGRGMGLDIVRRGVLRLRGSLRVEQRSEGGTRFVLELPLTLAIVPALIFESEGELLALPTLEVRQTITRTRAERVGGADVVRHGEELLPLARPARIFGWSPEPRELSRATSDRGGFAIIVGNGDRTAAIQVDRLVDQRSVVVKALPSYLGPLRGVSGATVAPDGRVILLLDGGALLELNIDSHRRGVHAG